MAERPTKLSRINETDGTFGSHSQERPRRLSIHEQYIKGLSQSDIHRAQLNKEKEQSQLKDIQSTLVRQQSGSERDFLGNFYEKDAESVLKEVITNSNKFWEGEATPEISFNSDLDKTDMLPSHISSDNMSYYNITENVTMPKIDTTQEFTSPKESIHTGMEADEFLSKVGNKRTYHKAFNDNITSYRESSPSTSAIETIHNIQQYDDIINYHAELISTNDITYKIHDQTSTQEITFDNQEESITKSLNKKVEEFKEKINKVRNGTPLDKDISAALDHARPEKKFRHNLEKLRQKGEDIDHICNVAKYIAEKGKTPKLCDLYSDIKKEKATITLSDEATDLAVIVLNYTTLELEDGKRKKLRQLLTHISETSRGRQKLKDDQRSNLKGKEKASISTAKDIHEE